MATKRTYRDLPAETRKRMKATEEPAPEPRYAESFLKEAYAMKLVAERTTDPEEAKWARQRERTLLASAQRAPFHPESPRSRKRSPQKPSPSKRSSTRSRSRSGS